MPQIKGAGAPTRRTLGAMGDIYTDTNTGKKYECIFAYRDDQDNDFECQWKELKTEKIPSGKIPEKQPEEVAEEIKEEVKLAQKTVPHGRTNYAAYSKKNG